ncbi:MAG: dihydrolipoyl dehydrogenase [Clostridiales bacterium]|nr:dihydrolipoyl dehydrogenase [Clostridiales bacterium]
MKLIVIGGGPGGYELAAEAARGGYDVTLIERDLLGGTCLNRGCIPTKALLASADVMRMARNAARYGVDIPQVNASYHRAVERKNEIVDGLRQGVEQVLAGVNVVKGEARFVAPNAVEVDGLQYSADRIVVATGSEPARLPIPSAQLALTSDDLLAATSLPKSMVIVGGGVIGIEFATILQEFGVEVTIIEYCKEILPPFDRDIAKRLRSHLSRQGINVIVGAAVVSIEPGRVNYEQRGKQLSIDAHQVLMAVGRKPVIPAGLLELGVEVDRRGIVVDDNMKTSVDGIYAIGDVNGRCMLAHAASAQGRVFMGEKVNLDVVPSAVFSNPECAMVGITEEQARQQGCDITVGKAMFRSNGKAVAIGETDGMVKLVVNAADRLILGCHVMGPHASDMVQAVADMMVARQPVDILVRTIHAHPTISEVMQAAALSCK